MDLKTRLNSYTVKELKEFIIMDNSTARDFLRIYALGKLTSAPSIKRARAKLQEEEPGLRGNKYKLRKKTYNKEWRKIAGV